MIQTAKTSSSSPAVSQEEPTSGPSDSSTQTAESTATSEEQTIDQPAAVPSEASSSSPVDLSTKKSTEAETEASAAVTTSQGMYQFNTGFISDFHSLIEVISHFSLLMPRLKQGT